MTTLHFVFDLNININDLVTNTLLQKIKYSSNVRTQYPQIQSEIDTHFEGQYDPRIVEVINGIFDNIIGSKFDNDGRYHVWIQNNNIIIPQRLSNGLVDITPEEMTFGIRNRNINFTLVPTLHKMFVISEVEIDVNQLPQSSI